MEHARGRCGARSLNLLSRRADARRRTESTWDLEAASGTLTAEHRAVWCFDTCSIHARRARDRSGCSSDARASNSRLRRALDGGGGLARRSLSLDAEQLRAELSAQDHHDAIGAEERDWRWSMPPLPPWFRAAGDGTVPANCGRSRRDGIDASAIRPAGAEGSPPRRRCRGTGQRASPSRR